MADFNISYKHTAINEGGYANHPKDKGGETYAGVSRKNWPNWGGWRFIDGIKQQHGTTAAIINKYADASEIVHNLVLEFYKTNFWYPLNLNLVNDQQLANNVYDFAVNAGVTTAAKRLQRAAGVKYDGIIGNKTILAVNSQPAKKLYDAFNDFRKAYYDNIIANNPSQAVFKNSWYSRIIPYKV